MSKKEDKNQQIKTIVLGISIMIILYCKQCFNNFTSIEKQLFTIGCIFILVNQYLVTSNIKNKRFHWFVHIVYPIITFLATFLVNSNFGYILTVIFFIIPLISQCYFGQCILDLQHNYNGVNYQFLKISSKHFLLINTIGLTTLLYRYMSSSPPGKFKEFIYIGLTYTLWELIMHNYNLTYFKKFSLLNSDFNK
tara:strand:+ start:112 stop:693 length:582 start_codon:yes stop_codon:yes gene_type:complete